MQLGVDSFAIDIVKRARRMSGALKTKYAADGNERRVARDRRAYTQDDFTRHFGEEKGQRMWGALKITSSKLHNRPLGTLGPGPVRENIDGSAAQAVAYQYL